MSSSLPEQIDHELILGAMRSYRSGVDHPFAASTKYDVLDDAGRRYPPKAIVGLAVQEATSQRLASRDFSGGAGSKCFRLLEEAGFAIVPKPTGAVWRLIAHHNDRDHAVELVRTKRRIAIGWGATGDLREMPKPVTAPEIRKRITEMLPKNRNATDGGQSLRRLLSGVQVGDRVVVKGHKAKVVVEVTGPYQWVQTHDLEGGYWHQRPVRVLPDDPEEVLRASGSAVDGESMRWTLLKIQEQKDVALCPLVLVENEATAGGHYDHWADITGERYQYPNQYRKKIQPGRRFIYYRGSRRTDGGRGTPEYFGQGVIGEVRLDQDVPSGESKSGRRWSCDVVDYQPFAEPVAFRIDGKHFEDIPKNRWGVAVREISEDAYSAIVQAAGGVEIAPAKPLVMPDLEEVVPTVAGGDEQLLAARKPKSGGGKAGGSGRRRSRFSVEVGRRGEEIVLAHLKKTLPAAEAATVRWTADEGDTPGWDIEFVRDGELIGVEVKASSTSVMATIEVTQNEWRAAEKNASRYWLALVVNATTASPSIQILSDPFALVSAGKMGAEPSGYRIWRTAEDEQRNA